MYQISAPIHTIRVASHNVFWFQGSSFATDVPAEPCPEIMAALCSLYKEIGADIWCLQEIQSECAARTVAGMLEMEYIYQPGGKHPQYGGAVFSRWPLEQVFLQQSFTPDRVLLGVKIHPEGLPSFCLMNIHLPSNRQRGNEGGQSQRLQEISAIAGEADLLLGDFNEAPDGGCASLLKNRGCIDLAPEFSTEETGTYLGNSSFRFDQIWISSKKWDAVQSYFAVPKERLIWDDKIPFLSDHIPVGCVIDVKVLLDN